MCCDVPVTGPRVGRPDECPHEKTWTDPQEVRGGQRSPPVAATVHGKGVEQKFQSSPRATQDKTKRTNPSDDS